MSKPNSTSAFEKALLSRLSLVELPPDYEDVAAFTRLLSDIAVAANMKDCPRDIVLEVERVLTNSFTLPAPEARREIAISCRSLAAGFAKGKFAAMLEGAVKRGVDYFAAVVDGVMLSGVICNRRELEKITFKLKSEHLVYILPLLRSSAALLTPVAWRNVGRLMNNRQHWLSLEVYENLLATFRASAHWPNDETAATFLLAIRRVVRMDWPEGRPQEIFNLLWPDTLSPNPPEWVVGVLAIACALYGDKAKFTDFIGSNRLDVPHSSRTIGAIAYTAAVFDDPTCLRRLFEMLKEWTESDKGNRPFVLKTNQKAWMTLLRAALDLNEIDLLMEIFRDLSVRFDPFLYSNWGYLNDFLRPLAMNLEPEYADEIFLTLNHASVDPERCLECLRTEKITPLLQAGGVMPFAGAARELMQAMIGILIKGSREEFHQRMKLVVDGIFSLPDDQESGDRRNAALFHLLARGQQSYAGAIHERPRQGLYEIANRLDRATAEEAAALCSDPNTLKNEITSLIALGFKPPVADDLPEDLRPIEPIVALMCKCQGDYISLGENGRGGNGFKVCQHSSKFRLTLAGQLSNGQSV